MQLLPSLLTTAALTALAHAQVNPFVFYPQDPERQALTCTSFVGRPDMAAAGEALMMLETEHFRGVGDANGAPLLFGVYHWLADEKLSTPETYGIVVRKSLPTGEPDMSAAGEYVRVNGLTTPPSTNPNRGTWICSDGFNQPTAVWIVPVPAQTLAPARYFVGIDLPANPLWPTTDGHSLFRADLLSAGTGATFGENHRPGVPHPTWAGKQGVPSFTTPWTYVLGPFVTSPNLHIGGIDPTSNRLGAPGANLSMNGLYPDISGQPRRDGLMVRITDNIAPFSIVALGASFGFQQPYFEWSLIGTLIGHAFIIGGGGPIIVGAAPMNVGVHEFPIALPNTLSPTLIGTDVAFQGLVWDLPTNLAEWTNAQEVHL